MAEIKIIPKEKQLPKMVKVAAYARVSSDKDSMLHSLSSQVSYFSKMIQEHDGWQYVGVYSDEGMTGTKRTRKGFEELISDAKKGKIDVILTKSLSRFARNTVDCLKTIRELKAINVDIYFEEQNIHTLSSNGEFLISLLAGFAQEESRACSENTLWRVRKNFSEGKPYGGTGCLGYKLTKDKFSIIPEEAEIVKKIFELYLNGNGMMKIAHILNDENVKPIHSELWSTGTIRGILINPIYKGNLVLQKTYTENHLTKKTKVNNGEKTMYVVENNHEQIIDTTTFDNVQELMKKKKKHIQIKSNKERTYVFTGKIICGMCGKTYKHKITPYYEQWICRTYDNDGKKYCNSHQIRDDVLKSACSKALEIETFSESVFLSKINYIESFNDYRLVFHFYDGTVKTINWEIPSRKNSWTDSMKQKARERAREYNGNSKSNTK